MEGLEISEIKYSYLNKNNIVFRFDSSYFLKEYLNEEALIRSKNHSTLKDIGAELKSFGAYSLNNEVHYLDAGIPFIRGVNMKKGRISFNDMIFIDGEANKLLWKSEVRPKMILLSMSGTLGDVAIASKNWKYPINSNQDIAKIDTKHKINPYLLYAFLSSKFGQNYLKREARGSVQQHVFLSQMDQFEIPLLNKLIVDQIQKAIENSDDLMIRADNLYSEAETLLLESIGLTNFKPSVDPVNVVGFKDSFLLTGRLDAEYYQKKYEDYLQFIYNHPLGFEPLQTVCHVKDTNYTPKDKLMYKYIELANVGKSGEINGCTTAPGKEMPSRARRRVNTNDILISSIEGSLNSCALVSGEYDRALCSTGFYVINSRKINAETLLVLFKSELMQNILKQNCSGTILTAINKTEFLNIPIPLVDQITQKEIKSKISESFQLKNQSELLLETAKRAVEIAIEQDEEAALGYISSQIGLAITEFGKTETQNDDLIQ